MLETKEIGIGKSKNGQGLFVKKNFSKGESIFEVKGSFLSCDEDEVIDEKTRSNSLRFDEEKYLSPAGELGDFLNHSCEPNSAIVKKMGKLFVVAVKEVSSGDEVTMDYSTIIASDDSWEMKCRCGSEHCRGNIGKFTDLPKRIQKAYLSLSMVPDYILD